MQKGELQSNWTFSPSTLKLRVKRKKFCENVNEMQLKRNLFFVIKCMKKGKNEIWKSDKAFKLRKTEMKMKFRNC